MNSFILNDKDRQVIDTESRLVLAPGWEAWGGNEI